MTQITARGWPGLANYKPPEGRARANPTSQGDHPSLRNYDLWLVPYFKDGRGAVIAMSGSVELARIDLPDEKAIRDWCDPLGTVKTHPYGLWRAYQPNVAIVGWDLGYTFGQIAEYWSTCRDKSYSLWPYGWGKPLSRSRYTGTSPHRPPLRMRPRDKGWQVWWGKPKAGPPGRYGKWVNGKLFTGNFIDLQSVAFALGIVEPAWPEDPMLRARVLRELALAIDQQAQQWYGGSLDTRTLSSPATLAKGLLQRIGVAPPLKQFATEGRLPQWVSNLSGGWLECSPDHIGKPTSVVPLDLSSAYALSWCLSDCWSVLTADHFEERDAITTIDMLLTDLSIGDMWPLQPYWWHRLGCTLVEVLPDGEPWPVELGDLQRAYVPLTSKQPMWFPWQTVVAAAVISSKTPKVLSATKLVPVGKQRLHNADVLPGLSIRAHKDPVPELVKHRNEYPVLKTVINSLCWGILSEFHATKSTETPGPWCFPPIAATVAAGPRLLLALLDRMVRDAGGSVVYRDTDSSFITPQLCGYFTRHFAALDQGWGVWKEGEPCNILVRGVKKYILFDNAGNLLDWKESNLRGTYEDPPGHPDWTKDYHERIVRRELGLPVTGPVPTYLRGLAYRRLQSKPGDGNWPGRWREETNGDSYLTRLRLWHTDAKDHGPDHINVTSIRYKGSPADAIKANREARDLARTEYGRTCPGCGTMLPEHCRKDKVYCSGRCRKRVTYVPRSGGG
jgi:hypothetical protein